MSCSLRLPPPGMRDQKPLLQAVAERKIYSPWIEGYQTYYWGCTCNNDIINNAPQNWNLFFKIPHEMNCFNTNVWICIIGPSLAHYSRPDSIGLVIMHITLAIQFGVIILTTLQWNLIHYFTIDHISKILYIHLHIA